MIWWQRGDRFAGSFRNAATQILDRAEAHLKAGSGTSHGPSKEMYQGRPKTPHLLQPMNWADAKRGATRQGVHIGRRAESTHATFPLL
jgi:hypothetical protein